MSFRILLSCALVALASAAPLAAQDTGPAGGGQPHYNVKPGLGINFLVQYSGAADNIGLVRMFAGSVGGSPIGGFYRADGQVLTVGPSNTTLAQRLGATYGGNGTTTFGVPDLQGRSAIGTGAGPGLSNRTLGSTVGSAAVTLNEAQLPAHQHAVPPGAGGAVATGTTGGSQPHPNMGPSLSLNYSINTGGVFPVPSSFAAGTAGASAGANLVVGNGDFLGRVNLHAAAIADPGSRAPAQGQPLSISQYEELFVLTGTTFGGDGQTTFATPDLRGRAPTGATSAASSPTPNRTRRFDGETYGTEQVTLTDLQMPPHAHSLAPTTLTTGPAGAGQPHDNLQPSTTLRYLIALQGQFPTSNTTEASDVEPYLAEVALFAGSFVPRGWALAEGQLLPINQNQALFSLLGTTYGGDGRVTFALPDLRSRTAMGTGTGPEMSLLLGEVVGAERVALTLNEMPTHTHSVVGLPEPTGLIGLALCTAAAALRRRRRCMRM